VLFPWEVRSICRDLGKVESHGVYLPLQYRLHRRGPRLAARIARWASVFPLNYIAKNLIVVIRIPTGHAE